MKPASEGINRATAHSTKFILAHIFAYVNKFFQISQNKNAHMLDSATQA